MRRRPGNSNETVRVIAGDFDGVLSYAFYKQYMAGKTDTALDGSGGFSSINWKYWFNQLLADVENPIPSPRESVKAEGSNHSTQTWVTVRRSREDKYDGKTLLSEEDISSDADGLLAEYSQCFLKCKEQLLGAVKEGLSFKLRQDIQSLSDDLKKQHIRLKTSAVSNGEEFFATVAKDADLLYITTARQTKEREYLNAANSISSYDRYVEFSNKHKVELVPQLMEDVHRNLPAGQTLASTLASLEGELKNASGRKFQKASESHWADTSSMLEFDSKLDLLYFQMQDAARRVSGKPVEFHFYDDRKDIYDAVFEEYFASQGSIPANVTLVIHRVDVEGGELTDCFYDSIKGSSNILSEKELKEVYRQACQEAVQVRQDKFKLVHDKVLYKIADLAENSCDDSNRRWRDSEGEIVTLTQEDDISMRHFFVGQLANLTAQKEGLVFDTGMEEEVQKESLPQLFERERELRDSAHKKVVSEVKSLVWVTAASAVASTASLAMSIVAAVVLASDPISIGLGVFAAVLLAVAITAGVFFRKHQAKKLTLGARVPKNIFLFECDLSEATQAGGNKKDTTGAGKLS